MVIEEIEDLSKINLHKEFRQANDPETPIDKRWIRKFEQHL